MSGAVSRRVSCWTDILFSERWYTNYDRMERIAESEIDNNADHQNKRVICPAGGLGGRFDVVAAFGGDARVNAPGQKRSEQQNRAKVAIRKQVRQGPGFHSREHRVFEPRLDVAGYEGGD